MFWNHCGKSLGDSPMSKSVLVSVLLTRFPPIPLWRVRTTCADSFPEQRLVIEPISFSIICFRGQTDAQATPKLVSLGVFNLPTSNLNLFVWEPGMKSIVLFNFSTKTVLFIYVHVIILSKVFHILVAPKFLRFQMRERLLGRQTILFYTPVCDSKPGKSAMFLREWMKTFPEKTSKTDRQLP